MNKRFGRRGTIFVACASKSAATQPPCQGSGLLTGVVVSAVACIWQAFTNSWWAMFIARFMLGLGIGPNSATARESCPRAGKEVNVADFGSHLHRRVRAKGD